MARPKNSPEKIQDMRNRMMDAVIDLLENVSPDKVSIRMIAEKIGVSHMVFYTYFKDRAEIIHALIEREQYRTNQRFDEMIGKAKDSPVKDVLKEFIIEYSKTGHERPKIFRLFWLAESSGNRKALKTFQHLETIYQKMAQLLDYGMKQGEFKRKDSLLAAFVVMSMINGPIITHFCGNKPDKITCDQVRLETAEAVNAYLSK